MPFGLALAPFVLTKLIAYLLSVLRETGIQSVAYLDDWILWSSSEARARQDCQQARSVLWSLGFPVNVEVSANAQSAFEVARSRQLDKERVCALTEEYFPEVLELLEQLFAATAVTQRAWERLFGNLAFAVMVTLRGKLFLHEVARAHLILEEIQR